MKHVLAHTASNELLMRLVLLVHRLARMTPPHALVHRHGFLSTGQGWKGFTSLA